MAHARCAAGPALRNCASANHEGATDTVASSDTRGNAAAAGQNMPPITSLSVEGVALPLSACPVTRQTDTLMAHHAAKH